MNINNNNTLENSPVSNETADAIIDIFRNFHRKSTNNDQFEKQGKFILHSKIKTFNENEVLQFVLPGFPCKSPNTIDKVLGHLPDLGEQMALDNLQRFTEKIHTIHKPGATIHIASDGRVFNDIIGVSDQKVSEFKCELIKMLGENSTIKILGLEEFIPGGSFSAIRNTFDVNFCDTPEHIQSMIQSNEHVKNLFMGLKRFLHDDIVSTDPECSKTQMQKNLSIKAKEALRRSLGFDKVISTFMPHHIRLSIHPHTTANGKFGFNLINNTDNRGTPWHNTIMQQGEKVILIKRKDAELLGGKIINKNGRPRCFRAELP